MDDEADEVEPDELEPEEDGEPIEPYVVVEISGLSVYTHHGVDEAERKRIVARIQEIIARDVPLLPLFYPASFSIVRKATFDQWYITPGGVAGVIPTIANKQVFVTGLKTGVKVRPTQP